MNQSLENIITKNITSDIGSIFNEGKIGIEKESLRVCCNRHFTVTIPAPGCNRHVRYQTPNPTHFAHADAAALLRRHRAVSRLRRRSAHGPTAGWSRASASAAVEAMPADVKNSRIKKTLSNAGLYPAPTGDKRLKSTPSGSMAVFNGAPGAALTKGGGEAL